MRFHSEKASEIRKLIVTAIIFIYLDLEKSFKKKININ